MKYLLPILCMICWAFSLPAQSHNTAVANQYADKLFEVEILSEHGKEVLKQYINDFPKEFDGNSPHYPIVSLVGAFFLSDYYYRSGLYFMEELFASEGLMLNRDFFSKKERNDFLKKWKKKIKKEEAYNIENRIVDEDHLHSNSSENVPILYGGLKMEFQDVIHHKRSVMGKTCRRTLKDLLSLRLIEEFEYEKTLRIIDAGEIQFEFQLFNNLFEILEEKHRERKFKESLPDLITNLFQMELISQETYSQLSEDAKNDSLRHPFDLVPFCKHYALVDTNQFKTDPNGTFHHLFTQFASWIPDFTYSNLSIHITESEEVEGSGFFDGKGLLTFEANHRNYRSEFYYYYLDKMDGIEKQPFWIPCNGITHGVNKYLADQQSPYRIHFASRQGMKYSNLEPFGFLLMTQEQYHAWDIVNLETFIREESFDTTFSSHSLESLIKDYERIGLFNHLSSQEMEEGKNCVAKSDIESYTSILACYPKQIIGFDFETSNFENPYEELTEAFAEISRGAFTPSNIRDNSADFWDSGKVEYSFEFQGTKYSIELLAEGDWLDGSFIDLINQALKEKNAGGEFYFCIDDGQAAGYIYLTKAQYEFIKTNQPTFFPEY